MSGLQWVVLIKQKEYTGKFVTWTHGDERDHFRLCRDAKRFWPCDGRPEHTWGRWGTHYIYRLWLTRLREHTFQFSWSFNPANIFSAFDFFYMVDVFFRNFVHENHANIINFSQLQIIITLYGISCYFGHYYVLWRIG